jgi:hypothetical protein
MSKQMNRTTHQKNAAPAVHVNTPETCVICGGLIVMQIFKSTGVCSEDHRKQRDGERDQPGGPRL